ncbi:WcaI family glycosyltransferase [Kriegella sp. EG-1]|nr:WcaI family glycosyltransferase [Flavobacteriaceae bacterium EG-1]
MGKNLLLVGYNYYPELTGIGKYSSEMINWLAENDYDCEVITTYPYYPYWSVQEPYRKKRFWYSTEIQKVGNKKVKVHRCPMYVPKKPSGLKRMLLDISFFISAFLMILVLLPKRKFDYILTVAPSFQVGLLGYFYKKIRKAKHIYHIQDLQIEMAKDLNMIKSPKVINALFKVENFIMKNSDTVSSISKKMVDKVQKKSQKEVVLFPNWSDTKSFYPLPNRGKIKEDFGFKAEDKIILYSGGMGEKQGLDAILYAAQEHKKYQFIFCGTGPYKIQLRKMAKRMELKNVHFFPLQPHESFNSFLNMADLHLVVQKNVASDLVMPSKLNTILSVGGLALVTANKSTGLHNLVKKNKMGILVDAENQNALNQGINQAFSSTGEETRMTRNARIYAETHLSLNKVMKNFEDSALKNA